ncbi:hypothetical protein K1719_040932 [Acacia pycnantha]|nr:hypothetical protein K1719_040932 [Acacia pycnantha]
MWWASGILRNLSDSGLGSTHPSGQCSTSRSALNAAPPPSGSRIKITDFALTFGAIFIFRLRASLSLIAGESAGGPCLRFGSQGVVDSLERICSGVPLITFPLFGEQFYNEKVIVQVVETGMRVGCERAVHLGEEENFDAIQVKREKVKEEVQKVMGEDEEESNRSNKRKSRQYVEKAKKVVEKGGSSFLDMSAH